MAIASRLTSTGTYIVNGQFDEVTFNSATPVIKNLITYSEQFNNAVWGKQSGLTITPDSILAPNDTLTADTLAGNGVTVGYLGQTYTYTSGTSYTFSFFGKTNATSNVSILVYGTVFNNNGLNVTRQFNLSNGTTSQPGGTVAPSGYGITNYGNGWYRCWISHTATTTAANDQQLIRVTDISGSIYAWGYQVEVGTTPTIYQPIAAANTLVVTTGTAITNKIATDAIYVSGGFDEVTFNATTPVVNNLLPYTQQLDNTSYWFQSACSVTANAIAAPDGTLTADKINQTTSSARHGLQRTVTPAITANSPYTVSCFAKAGENNFVQLVFGKNGSPFTRAGSVVDLTTGSITNYNVGSVSSVTRWAPRALPNGWWRIAVTVTIDASSTDGYVEVNTLTSSTQGAGYIGTNTTDGTYVWGLQLEPGSTATAYQGIAAPGSVISQNFAKRDVIDGITYVSGIFDEVTVIT